MTDVKLSVGGNIEQEASRRFIDAWHRAESGENFQERHLAFESWESLSRILTSKRLELLRHVHRQPATSIRALAKSLGRDYANVHSDVQSLLSVGLIDTDNGGVRADYDAIETRIAI